jgi:hypothetical protein
VGTGSVAKALIIRGPSPKRGDWVRREGSDNPKPEAEARSPSPKRSPKPEPEARTGFRLQAPDSRTGSAGLGPS